MISDQNLLRLNHRRRNGSDFPLTGTDILEKLFHGSDRNSASRNGWPYCNCRSEVLINPSRWLIERPILPIKMDGRATKLRSYRVLPFYVEKGSVVLFRAVLFTIFTGLPAGPTCL